MGRLLVWARSAKRRRSQPALIIVMIMKLVSVRDDCVYCAVIIALLYGVCLYAGISSRIQGA
jgi:hypothetical protein